MKTKAELLIETLTKDSGRTVFTIEETKQLQEISFLEGNYLLDELDEWEWNNGKNELDEKIKKFKSQFVLTDEEWNRGIINDTNQTGEEMEVEGEHPNIKPLEEIIRIKAEKIFNLLVDHKKRFEHSESYMENQVSMLIDEIIIPTQDAPDVIFWEKIKYETIKIIKASKI